MAKTDASDRYLTPPKVAERYGVGVRKVLGWIETGELRAINVAASRNGRPRWVIAPIDLERFEQARSSSAAAPKIKRRQHHPAIKDFFPE